MRHDEREWGEGFAAALVVAGLAAVIYLARVCLTVGVRTVVKYPRQPVVLGIVASWVLALIVALAAATMPEGGVLAVWVALGATTLAVATLAVTEIVLDQRTLHRSTGDDELSGLQFWE